jgi:uncharacterized membrane protein
MRSTSVAQLSLAAAAWLWVAAVVLAPALVFPLGHFICHQRPERSFFFHGHQLAVCARCTGIYAGAAVAAPLAVLAALPVSGWPARVLLILAALPTAVTWTLEFAGVMAFSNSVRSVAGLPLGFAAAWLVLSTLSLRRPSPIGIAHRTSEIGPRPSTIGKVE